MGCVIAEVQGEWDCSSIGNGSWEGCWVEGVSVDYKDKFHVGIREKAKIVVDDWGLVEIGFRVWISLWVVSGMNMDGGGYMEVVLGQGGVFDWFCWKGKMSSINLTCRDTIGGVIAFIIFLVWGVAEKYTFNVPSL